MVRPRLWHLALGLIAAALVWPYPGQGQAPGAGAAPAGEWRAYSYNNRSNRYSPLDQITRDNVRTLEVAWTWKFDNYGTPAQTVTTQTTPIMVDGVLYFTAGQRRTVVAADAGTGETLWTWRPDEGERFDASPRKVHRGVSYWASGNDRRIVYVTPGFQLVSLDARTGRPVPGFGNNGVVDLFAQLDNDAGLDPTGRVGNSSPVVISNDVIVVGPASTPGGRANVANVKLDVMAFDARTGEERWSLDERVNSSLTTKSSPRVLAMESTAGPNLARNALSTSRRTPMNCVIGSVYARKFAIQGAAQWSSAIPAVCAP